MLAVVFHSSGNNGIQNGVLQTLDINGNATAVDLTGGTLTCEIVDRLGTILASFPATGVVPLTNGIFNAYPPNNWNQAGNCSSGKQYFFRIRLVNATWPQGYLFEQDVNGNRYTCMVYN